MTNNTRTATVLLALALIMTSCDGNRSPSPSGPATPAPTITAIEPNLGSTGGGTSVTITGSGFWTAVVKIGGIAVQGRLDQPFAPGNKIFLETPPHGAGTVDVVISNPVGQPVTVAGGYTYASPQSFDFNGSWSGYGTEGQDIPIMFTIQNNVLLSASCDAYASLTFSPPVSISNGEFSYASDDGVSVSGRIVSTAEAVGTMNLAPCTATRWAAGKY